jgi:DNA-binding transcriptional regulator YhcF (GntR family)
MEFDASIPIYLQVIESIKKDIVSGKIELGSKLPSTRELAVEKKINANTAARIYKELEYLDIAFTKRGIGTFITESEDTYERIKNELSQKYVKQFMGNMIGLGYDQLTINSLLDKYEE